MEGSLIRDCVLRDSTPLESVWVDNLLSRLRQNLPLPFRVLLSIRAGLVGVYNKEKRGSAVESANIVCRELTVNLSGLPVDSLLEFAGY
jgi:hypothetical protein